MSDRSREKPISKPFQYRLYLVLSVLVIGSTALLQIGDSPFPRFLGAFNPVGIMLLVAAGGLAVWPFLLAKGILPVHRRFRPRLFLPAAAIALLLAVLAILLDLLIRFPADMNIPFPRSVLFYPVIGFLVEALFHLLPLALLIWLASVGGRLPVGQEKTPWGILAAVALGEPLFQAWFMYGTAPSWAVVYLVIHLFVFNLVQLNAFWRQGFVAMYLLRLLYYLIWHVIWGVARLEVLYPS